jgi:hypothetical protein
MRPGRPTAGHATAGEADTLTELSGDAPEALIGTRTGSKGSARLDVQGNLSSKGGLSKDRRKWKVKSVERKKVKRQERMRWLSG